MKSSLTIKHDYLTLRVTDSTGTRLNFTIGRSGEKVSGTPGLGFDREAFKKAADGFMAFVKKAENYGDAMRTAKEMAEKANSFSEFGALLSA